MHELAGVGALLIVIFLGTYILQAVVVAIAIAMHIIRAVWFLGAWLVCFCINPRAAIKAVQTQKG